LKDLKLKLDQNNEDNFLLISFSFCICED
jgi:hypothetical protein